MSSAIAISVGSAVVGSVVSSSMGGGSKGSEQAAGAADPFASQRGQYQTMLSNMMTGKSNISDDPSYKFRLAQGEASTNAGAAASGMLNSGNRLLALQNYGQGAASQEYANQFSRLSQLAGANVGSPAAAGQILQGQNTANQQAAGAVGSTVSNAISGWLGGSGSSGGSGSTGGWAPTVSSGSDFSTSGAGYTGFY